ncbi:aminoglycoside phosphotransferase (APT) family kinase protein [Streptomyces sp. 846.5]|nr:phosphotransferase family protein [Streptomyces sp. 846.5]TDT98340.1 aminoglycoside phosphotransferase (APT) family kinase protein [Streptomyces sp. 846.5]
MNNESLAHWLDGQGIAPGEPLETSLISGGTSNDIHQIRRGDLRMVLRKPPEKVPPGRDKTMLREYRVLKALNGTDVPHPEAIAVCDDTSVVGSCFYLMEEVDGWSPMNTNGWPEPYLSDLSLRPGLAYQLVEGIARLGNVDWRAQGLEGFGTPEGFHDRQVDRWLAHLAKFQFRELPGLDQAAAWLRAHRPSHWEPGIIHGDYQFANVMFRHEAPAQLAALVDFEMSTVGDPLLDLGWVLMGWPNADEDRSQQGYADYNGMPDRADLIEHYAKVSGRDVSETDYYVILARFKMAVVLEGGYARHVKGDGGNPKMAYYGDAVLQMAAGAAELAATTKLAASTTL